MNNEAMPINDVIAKHFDRKNYVTWLAMNMVLDNRDTNSQNFLLYSPRNSATWTFVPWDYDAAWGFYDQPNEAAGRGSDFACAVGVLSRRAWKKKKGGR